MYRAYWSIQIHWGYRIINILIGELAWLVKIYFGHIFWSEDNLEVVTRLIFIKKWNFRRISKKFIKIIQRLNKYKQNGLVIIWNE